VAPITLIFFIYIFLYIGQRGPNPYTTDHVQRARLALRVTSYQPVGCRPEMVAAQQREQT